MRLWLAVSLLTLQLVAGCSAADQHPPAARSATPVDLVREFLARDGRGDRLRADAWMTHHTIWGPSEAGWDGYLVITGYHFRTMHADSVTARIEVTYDVAGVVDVDTSAHYTRRPRTETVTFTVMLTDTGWQIATPIVEPHVLANGISPRTTFSAADWAVVREEIRRVTPSP